MFGELVSCVSFCVCVNGCVNGCVFVSCVCLEVMCRGLLILFCARIRITAISLSNDTAVIVVQREF